MEFLEPFAASLPSRDTDLYQDVEEYLQWQADRPGQADQAGGGFKPDASDDVAIRTYLLEQRVGGARTPVLNRIRSSLEYFYSWLEINGFVLENPFKKYNLKWPFITQKHIRAKHDAFTGSSDERELSHLRALNRLAESTNRALDTQSMLNGALETLLEVMDLKTAWISLKADAGFVVQPDRDPPAHGYLLAAAHNLPPSLEQSDQYYLRRPPVCNCQKLLNSGKLKHGVNIVECSRLQEFAVTNRDTYSLMFHASVPIISGGQAIGVMNVAAQDWQFLSSSDLKFMTDGAKQIGASLERAHMYDLFQIQHAHLTQELNMARKVQVSLLPEKLPKITGYDLAAFWKPAFETSGDYYNIFKLPGGRWGFIVADVSDKGAAAALYMALTHGLIRERVENESSPAELLRQVNRALYYLDIQTNFVTSFYGILDPVMSSFKYALAGHPPPLLRKDSGQVETLPGKGIAMGITPNAQYKDMELVLAPGDSLISFTDGITDANNSLSEYFELTQLKQAISSAPAQAPALLDHLKMTLGDWIKEAPNFDDITLLVIGKNTNGR